MNATELDGEAHRGSVSAAEPRPATLPNFLILGAQKAGTTALFYALSKHPEIFASKNKEPSFFTDSSEALAAAAGPGDEDTRMMDSLEDYEALFAETGDAVARGEASTSYLYDFGAPERIRRLLPGAKLIAILRNPVERAYSNFLYLVREGREPLHDFRAALAEEGKRREEGWATTWRYLDKGLYAAQIERYFAQFDRDQLRCYLYEEYDEDPQATVTDVYRFLGVDDSFSQDLSVRLNVSGLPKSKRLQSVSRRSRRLKWMVDPILPDRLRNGMLKAQNTNLSRPPLPPDLRAELTEACRSDIERVGELTGLDVSRWLEIEPGGAK
jgi:hypothetical protein